MPIWRGVRAMTLGPVSSRRQPETQESVGSRADIQIPGGGRFVACSVNSGNFGGRGAPIKGAKECADDRPAEDAASDGSG